MKKYFLYLICFLLSACSGNFVQVNLVPSNITRAPEALNMELKIIEVTIADESAQTGKVQLNTDFPAIWRDAIQIAVDQAGLFKDDVTNKATISTLITKFEFNPIGFSNTCDVEATYTLLDRKTGQTIFEKHITTTASDNVFGTMIGVERSIKLWNKATQENISKFVDALKEAHIEISVGSYLEKFCLLPRCLLNIADFEKPIYYLGGTSS